jgi:heavy metal sensor kinase
MEYSLPNVGALSGVMRSLRMRLTLSYALLFALLLVSIGFIFRQAITVIMRQQNERVLDGEWAAARGFLRSENGRLVWAYNPESPEEVAAVERIRRFMLLTDDQGTPLEVSKEFTALERENREEIKGVLRTGRGITVLRATEGQEPYLIRMGLLHLQGGTVFMALGLPAGEMQTLPGRLISVYFSMVPVMLLAVSILGWFAAGRAMHPLLEVVEATSAVSAGNLSLRIRPLGSGDELDTLIATFNRMMERLEQSFERVRQFSIDASHELRTPLTAVRGQLEVALMTARTKEQYREAIESALQDVERLSQIVKSLLLLAQAESGQVPLTKERQDLTPIVAELVTQFLVAGEEKQIRIVPELADRCPGEVDRLQFERLIYNLLSNALKFTQPGGEIHVSLARVSDHIRLVISDNGPGIPAAHLPHIFERFYRVREQDNGDARGAGLGLSFVAWIVQAHGGKVEVSSSEEHGTTFEVNLPAGGPEEVAEHEETAAGLES